MNTEGLGEIVGDAPDPVDGEWDWVEDERLRVLERTVDAMNFRLDALDKRVAEVHNDYLETAKELAMLKRDFDREVALFKWEIDNQKKRQEEVNKDKEEWGRKLCIILSLVLAVLSSTALTLAITLYFK